MLERQTPQHLHQCPVCHREERCLLDCSLVLSPQGEWPRGAYCCCSDACQRAQDAAVESRLTSTYNTAQTNTLYDTIVVGPEGDRIYVYTSA